MRCQNRDERVIQKDGVAIGRAGRLASRSAVQGVAAPGGSGFSSCRTSGGAAERRKGRAFEALSACVADCPKSRKRRYGHLTAHVDPGTTLLTAFSRSSDSRKQDVLPGGSRWARSSSTASIPSLL